MWLKGKIQRDGRLDGKLPTLHKLVMHYYPMWSVTDARKAARHCRETLEAYEKLSENTELDLTDLEAEEKKVYTSHRRVFDTSTNELKFVADMPLTEKEQKQVATQAKKAERKISREEELKKKKKEVEAAFQRKDRAKRSPEQALRDNEGSKKRKAELKARKQQ